MQYEKVIKGNIPLEDGKVLENGLLAIKNGKIKAIFEDEENFSAKEFIDSSNCWVLPGGIDVHVHCYSEPREGINGATKSAAGGGVTTIIEMPYDSDEPVWNVEKLLAKKEIIKDEANVDVALLGTIKPDADLSVIHDLDKNGVCGYKLSMFNTHSFRFPRINEGKMYAAFQEIKKTGRVVGLHAENDDIVNYFLSDLNNYDSSDPLVHCKSRPAVAESVAVATALEIAKWTGVNLHFHHTTIPRAIDLVEKYRKEGVNVSVETCIQYLLLSEESMNKYGARAKVNPPLRHKEDLEGLWEKCSSGEVNLVASDHAPWQLDKKSFDNIFDNSSGAPGVETLFPLLFSEGVMKNRISIFDFIRLMSINPARVYGLSDQKGSIGIGKDADIVIIDPNKKSKIDGNKQHSFAGWSLYEGYELEGKITHSFLRGELIYDGNDVLSKEGNGTFIAPTHKAKSPITKINRQ